MTDENKLQDAEQSGAPAETQQTQTPPVVQQPSEGSAQGSDESNEAKPEGEASAAADAKTEEVKDPVPEPVVESKPEETKDPVPETPAPEPVKAPEPEKAPAPTAKTTTDTKVVEQGPLQSALDNIAENGTKAEKNLMFALNAYATAMAPGKPITAEEGSRRQYALLTALRSVIESAPEGEFKRLWNLVLAFAHLHKDGVFDGRYINRFAESWHRSVDELSALQRLINLITITADSETRSNSLKSFDLTRTLEFGFTDSARARLVGFYTN